MKFGIFAAFVLLAGCQSATEPTRVPVSFISLNNAELAMVDEGVRRAMKDPASAMIRDVSATAHNGQTFACGYVNARNSFGGYVGDTPFIGMFANGSNGEVFVVIGVDASPSGIAATRQHCAMYGIQV